MVGSQARGLLARARPRSPGGAAQADGSGWPRVEAGGRRSGGADERRGLLQHGAGLQEPGLLLQGRGLAVQGGRGREGRPQEGGGLMDGGGGCN